MAAPDIQRVETRKNLKPRQEPYWQRLAAGQYIGFRKLKVDSQGTWYVRMRDPGTGKKAWHSLGEFEHLTPSERFDAAQKEANAWLGRAAKGGRPESVTVARACETYVKHIRATKGDGTADDTEARFRRHVTDDPIASIVLDKLTRDHTRAWRVRLVKKPTGSSAKSTEARKKLAAPRAASSVNRDMAALRAALNHALEEGLTTSDFAWAVPLKPAKNANGRRTLYLDRDQRRSLIEQAAPDAANLLKGLAVLPLRPGALAALKVAHFDPKLHVIIIGKDKAGHDRRIKLPKSTGAFLEDMAKGKKPEDPLLSRDDGSAWTKDAWKAPIKEAAAKAGLPADTIAYTLRHSAITDLVISGLDLLTIAQLSGTSVEMIQDHYGHLRADHAADALAGLAL